ALCAVLLAATFLSHILPTIFALAGAGALFLVSKIDRHRLRYVGTALPVGLLLAGFWAVVFVFRMPYTNDMGWEKLTEYWHNLFPFIARCHAASSDACPQSTWLPSWTWHMWIVTILAGVGVLIAWTTRHRVGQTMSLVAVFFALLFRFMPQGRLWNARMLPFWYLSLYILAAVAVGELVIRLTQVSVR